MAALVCGCVCGGCAHAGGAGAVMKHLHARARITRTNLMQAWIDRGVDFVQKVRGQKPIPGARR